MTPDELMIQRAEAGQKYADLVHQVIEARCELAALDHVTRSPIAHRHNDGGFIGGDVNTLPHALAHSVFSPFLPNRRLSSEIEKRIEHLAASLRAPAA